MHRESWYDKKKKITNRLKIGLLLRASVENNGNALKKKVLVAAVNKGGHVDSLLGHKRTYHH